MGEVAIARRPRSGLPERALFLVRPQRAVELAEARFGLWAWEDPFAGTSGYSRIFVRAFRP